jgi:hypothetical protein
MKGKGDMKMNSINYKGTAAAAAVIAALLFQAQRAARADGFLLDTCVLHGNEGYGFGVSETARVCGFSFGGYYAFRTKPGGYMCDDLEGGAPDTCVHDYTLVKQIPNGSLVSIAYDIHQSPSGPVRIAGDVLPTNGHWQAYAYYDVPWTSPIISVAHLLQEPYGTTASSARAIVPAGTSMSHVLGYATVGSRSYACYWLAHTNGSIQLTNLGTTYLGTHTNSYALDTDGTNHVGYYNDGSESSNRGFIITGTNVQTIYAYSAGAALGISPSTRLIAGYYVSNGYTRPIYWRMTSGSPCATLLPLGTYSNGMARAVSDAGIIVGSIWNTANDEVACRWTTNGSVATLNYISGTTSYNLIRAYNINSASGKHTTGLMKDLNNNNRMRPFMFYDW